MSERGDHGAWLVAVDERGDRQFQLVRPADSLARDTNPTVSPDGRWLVFASSRGRTIGTSLWIAPLAPDAVPRPLTAGAAIESHPTWTPDGRAIVFESTRERGDFDLYRLAIAEGRAAGEPERLTSGAAHEVTPSVAADGRIIYAAITASPGGAVESHLETRAPDGAILQLTDGPADTSPAISPDGKTIAFARPAVHPAGADGDLWLLRGATATKLVELPPTDESGPVWSPDGRFVFATSEWRRANGKPGFSSVIVIDVTEPHPRARILEDRVGATVRLTPAVTRTPLDAAALDRDPEYLPELARIIAAEIAAQQQ